MEKRNRNKLEDPRPWLMLAAVALTVVLSTWMDVKSLSSERPNGYRGEIATNSEQGDASQSKTY